MMTKRSIVKDIKSAGEPYNGQYGTLYGFYVTFENGDNGKYNSKDPNQTKFAVGQEATYAVSYTHLTLPTNREV